MTPVHRETDARGIEYILHIEQDDTPVRGNAMASGDDAADKALEDEIIARLDDGDVWAWACVTVKARYQGFEAHDTLGGCCYRDTAEFIQPGGYYGAMKSEAEYHLMKQLESACEAFNTLTTEVK